MDTASGQFENEALLEKAVDGSKTKIFLYL